MNLHFWYHVTAIHPNMYVRKEYVYCVPRSSDGVKFQPPGSLFLDVFLVSKGHKFHTLAGLIYFEKYNIYNYMCIFL